MNKNSVLLLTVAAIIAFGLVGCVSTSAFSFLNEGVSAPSATQASAIKIYTDSNIGRPYKELGGVSVSLANELDGKKYSEKLKQEAAKIGADAIVNFRQFSTVASGIAVKFE
jgi:hypothetical protein